MDPLNPSQIAEIGGWIEEHRKIRSRLRRKLSPKSRAMGPRQAPPDPKLSPPGPSPSSFDLGKLGQALGTGKSGFLGVSRSGPGWKAQIMHGRKNHGLGTYPTPEQAARAWDAKAVELRGPGTKLNFPGEHRTEAV